MVSSKALLRPCAISLKPEALKAADANPTKAHKALSGFRRLIRPHTNLHSHRRPFKPFEGAQKAFWAIWAS